MRLGPLRRYGRSTHEFRYDPTASNFRDLEPQAWSIDDLVMAVAFVCLVGLLFIGASG